MTQLIARTNVSDTYPLPSNANAKLGLAAMWDVVNEMSQAAEIDVASAATVAIGAQTTRKLRITGTTGITSFGTTYTGIVVVRFAAALTITHNATTLICPNGVSLTVAAGDIIIASPKATTSGTFDGWIITSANSASETNSLTAKTTPVGSDLLAIIDSVAGNVLKKLSLTNLAAWLAGLCSAGWNAATATSAISVNPALGGLINSNAAQGLFIQSKSGTSYDLSIINPTNTAYLARVVAGTNNWEFPSGTITATFVGNLTGNLTGDVAGYVMTPQNSNSGVFGRSTSGAGVTGIVSTGQAVVCNVTGTGVPLYVVPVSVAPTTSVVEGCVYYDLTLHKLRVRTATGWETITSV